MDVDFSWFLDQVSAALQIKLSQTARVEDPDHLHFVLKCLFCHDFGEYHI